MWIIDVYAKNAYLFISYHDFLRYVTDKAKLVQENERLRLAMTCKKCKITGVETLFLPCRHLDSCEKCASSMENCVTCNEKILGTVRTYVM